MTALAYRTVISANDRSGGSDRDGYFAAGLAALACVTRAIEAAGAGTPAAIVDLQCGFGQVCRMLRAAFPSARIIACDRDAGGVDFCAAELAAEPLYAPEDPSYLALPDSVDVIWCGALFTAVQPERWPALLERLTAALAPHGVLILATAGRRTGGERQSPPTSMSVTLAAIEQQPALGVIGLHEAGWLDLDVVSCVRRVDMPGAAADLPVAGDRGPSAPVGNIDYPPDDLPVSGTVIVNGWAMDSRGIREVRLFVDDLLVAVRTLTVERPDVAAAFPQFPHRHQRHGWTTTVTFVEPGDHRLTAETENIDGQVVRLGERRVKVGEVMPPYGWRSQPDPSLTAVVRSRSWFYEFDLPDGGRTESYLPPSMRLIHDTRLEMMWRALGPVVDGRWRERTAVDVACHQGFFAAQLARKGCRRVVGVDARAAHVADARLIARLYGLAHMHIEQRDVRDLEAADLGLFDIVLVFGLLYHVEDPVGLLRLARGLTRRVCLIETQLGPEGPDTLEWGTRDAHHQVKGTLSLVDEEGDTAGAQANLTRISMCPSLGALLWLMQAVGFSRVEVVPPGEGAHEQFASGARAMVAGYVDSGR